VLEAVWEEHEQFRAGATNDTSEYAYNYGCCLLELGNYSKAHEVLTIATFSSGDAREKPSQHELEKAQKALDMAQDRDDAIGNYTTEQQRALDLETDRDAKQRRLQELERDGDAEQRRPRELERNRDASLGNNTTEQRGRWGQREREKNRDTTLGNDTTEQRRPREWERSRDTTATKTAGTGEESRQRENKEKGQGRQKRA